MVKIEVTYAPNETPSDPIIDQPNTEGVLLLSPGDLQFRKLLSAKTYKVRREMVDALTPTNWDALLVDAKESWDVAPAKRDLLASFIMRFPHQNGTSEGLSTFINHYIGQVESPVNGVLKQRVAIFALNHSQDVMTPQSAETAHKYLTSYISRLRWPPSTDPQSQAITLISNFQLTLLSPSLWSQFPKLKEKLNDLGSRWNRKVERATNMRNPDLTELGNIWETFAAATGIGENEIFLNLIVPEVESTLLERLSQPILETKNITRATIEILTKTKEYPHLIKHIGRYITALHQQDPSLYGRVIAAFAKREECQENTAFGKRVISLAYQVVEQEPAENTNELIRVLKNASDQSAIYWFLYPPSNPNVKSLVVNNWGSEMIGSPADNFAAGEVKDRAGIPFALPGPDRTSIRSFPYMLSYFGKGAPTRGVDQTNTEIAGLLRSGYRRVENEMDLITDYLVYLEGISEQQPFLPQGYERNAVHLLEALTTIMSIRPEAVAAFVAAAHVIPPQEKDATGNTDISSYLENAFSNSPLAILVFLEELRRFKGYHFQSEGVTEMERLANRLFDEKRAIGAIDEVINAFHNPLQQILHLSTSYHHMIKSAHWRYVENPDNEFIKKYDQFLTYFKNRLDEEIDHLCGVDGPTGILRLVAERFQTLSPDEQKGITMMLLQDKYYLNKIWKDYLTTLTDEKSLVFLYDTFLPFALGNDQANDLTVSLLQHVLSFVKSTDARPNLVQEYRPVLYSIIQALVNAWQKEGYLPETTGARLWNESITSGTLLNQIWQFIAEDMNNENTFDFAYGTLLPLLLVNQTTTPFIHLLFSFENIDETAKSLLIDELLSQTGHPNSNEVVNMSDILSQLMSNTVMAADNRRIALISVPLTPDMHWPATLPGHLPITEGIIPRDYIHDILQREHATYSSFANMIQASWEKRTERMTDIIGTSKGKRERKGTSYIHRARIYGPSRFPLLNLDSGEVSQHATPYIDIDPSALFEDQDYETVTGRIVIAPTSIPGRYEFPFRITQEGIFADELFHSVSEQDYETIIGAALSRIHDERITHRRLMSSWSARIGKLPRRALRSSSKTGLAALTGTEFGSLVEIEEADIASRTMPTELEFTKEEMQALLTQAFSDNEGYESGQIREVDDLIFLPVGSPDKYPTSYWIFWREAVRDIMRMQSVTGDEEEYIQRKLNELSAKKGHPVDSLLIARRINPSELDTVGNFIPFTETQLQEMDTVAKTSGLGRKASIRLLDFNTKPSLSNAFRAMLVDWDTWYVIVVQRKETEGKEVEINGYSRYTTFVPPRIEKIVQPKRKKNSPATDDLV